MTGTGIQSIGGTSGLNQFVYSPYSFLDLEDLDPTYSTYPMYGNYGMDGSIFSAVPMYGGGLVGNTQDYFNQMRQYQQFYNDYNVDQQKMNRNADLRINASMEAIQTTYNALKDKIEKNEQGQIKEAYDRFVEAVANAYGQGTEQEIKARAATLYNQLAGKSIVQDLRENGRGSFGQGFLSTLVFGLYNAKSAEDNISAITGSPVATSDKAAQNIGRLAGAATVGLAIGLVASAPVGIIAGAVAFGISAIRGHSKK